MNYIKPIEEFLNEAISMKMYKENLPKNKYGRIDLTDGWSHIPTYRKIWDDLFGKDSKGRPVYRLSIPLMSKNEIKNPTSTPLMEEINSVFIPLGYKINSFEDYVYNKAYKIGDTKSPLKIGKLLSKIDNELFKKYDTSLERVEWKQKIENYNKDLKIIISRHPYDLIGMTSGREWVNSSCMRLGSDNDKVYNDIMCKLTGKEIRYESAGVEKDKIKQDIIEGVLIAYVVNIDDDNINNPKARLLIKPYVENTYYGKYDPPIWYPSTKIYGDFVEGFRDSVGAWLDTWQTKRYGDFVIKKGLYSDKQDEITITKPIEEWGEYEISNFMDAIIVGRNKDWGYGEDGRVNVNGNVLISYENKKFNEIFIHKYPNDFFTKLPIKFGVISGYFEINGRFGEDIDLYPTECKSFILRSNFQDTNPFGNMKDFKNFPLKKINKGSFWVDNANSLTSLEGIPEGIKSLYFYGAWELKNFKGLNEVYGETFNGNIQIKNLGNLTSFDGLPKKINGNLILHNMKSVESLDGLPKYVKGNLSMYGESLDKYTTEDILKRVKLGNMGKLDF